MEQTEVLAVRLPRRQKRELKRIAKEKGFLLSDLLRILIDEHLANRSAA